MKRPVVTALTVMLLLASAGGVFAASDKHIPGRTSRWVNDYARVIDPDTRRYLEQRIRSIKQTTPDPVEIIVATFKTIDNWDIKDFVTAYGERWREAKKGRRDNGVVIVLALKEGGVMMGVGRNLRKVVTDKDVDRIIKNIISPRAAKGEYSLGLKEGVEAVITIIEKGKVPATPAIMIVRLVLAALGCVLIVYLIKSYRDK
jgi:uncharacterized protein